jgi:hypothetical protein
MRGDQTTDTDDLDTGDATDTDDSDTGDDQDEQSDSSNTGDDSADDDDDDSTDEDTIDSDGYTPAQRAELDQLTEQSKQKDDHISNLGRELADLRQRVTDQDGGDAGRDDSDQGGGNEYADIDTKDIPEPLIQAFNILDANVKQQLTEANQTISQLKQDRQHEDQFEEYQKEFGGDRTSFDAAKEAMREGDFVKATKIVNLNSAANNTRKQQQQERDRLRTRSAPSGGSSYSSQQQSDDGNPVSAEVERINKLPPSQKQDAVSAIYGKYESETADAIASAIK